MSDTKTKIAAGLERAFAERGFAEPSVDVLREAAGVSLRTLYKYAPSRDDMVRAALEHRHSRYLDHVFSGLPDDPEAALRELIDRTATWMKREASHGCLFHAAVAAFPHDEHLQAILKRHKSEMGCRAAEVSKLAGHEADLTLILEGLTQSWPLLGERAVESAGRLAQKLRTAA